MLSEHTLNFERSATITNLTVTAKISNHSWAGTDDDIYISMGQNANFQLFCKKPEVGQLITVNIDLPRLFGKNSIHISELTHITLYQYPTVHPIASDDWELESLTITANDVFTNWSFQKVQRWLHNKSIHPEPVWSGNINWSKWTNSDHRPIDLNAQTYPVRWMPYISDLKSWRTYDPSKIDGVGQLVGIMDGRLVGEQLKTGQSEFLSSNSAADSYTWVYTPEGSIIYKLWQHELSRTDYIRHSQLGSGRPVICAGEFRIDRVSDTQRIRDVIAKVNDASGHYKPDGGSCLRYVAEKFQALGIDIDKTEWHWRQAPS